MAKQSSSGEVEIAGTGGQTLKTSVLPMVPLEDMREELESLGLTFEEIRARTAHLLPPPGGDFKPFFEEMERIGKELRDRKKPKRP